MAKTYTRHAIFFFYKTYKSSFLLLEMYPDTSAYILKNPFFFFLTQIRVHFPYYGSPIDVSCEMYFVPLHACHSLPRTRIHQR